MRVVEFEAEDRVLPQPVVADKAADAVLLVGSAGAEAGEAGGQVLGNVDVVGVRGELLDRVGVLEVSRCDVGVDAAIEAAPVEIILRGRVGRLGQGRRVVVGREGGWRQGRRQGGERQDVRCGEAHGRSLCRQASGLGNRCSSDNQVTLPAS